MNTHPSKLLNHEIMTLAVFILGGATKKINTEDVAIKANELAPGRYVWRNYKDQINIEIIRAFLSDAKKDKYGRLLTGSGTHGWMLTEAGLEFAVANSGDLRSADLSGEQRPKVEKNWSRAERQRLIGTSAFKKFVADRADDISDSEANSFFRIDEYVSVDTRERKIQRVVNEFMADSELGPVVKSLAPRARKGK